MYFIASLLWEWSPIDERGATNSTASGIPSKVKGCVYSRLATRLAPGDSKQRLRLPRGLKAGTYTVKIAFKPAGASWSASGTAKIVLRK
jgi:hypothetical protein